MSIATRTGDDGTTGLFGGARVPKDHRRVAAYGAVDELNACVGLARALPLPPDLDAALRRVQNDLFDLGAELATPRAGNPLADRVPPFSREACDDLDRDLERYEAETPTLKTFVLPGGVEAACRLHAARVVCRRAEREVVALSHVDPTPPQCVTYLNRLSDLLFVLARVANLREGVADVAWKARGRTP
ncbi:MAG TPA: cob(I)yrinic acid a,c-diamide adenosyltransferase [Planctomycetota bacterium]|nr:cob(I)yrinic acid a,c-diamide adenosyltransferase [Planctomycetota bacterium]